jgi:hypothetical protein
MNPDQMRLPQLLPAFLLLFAFLLHACSQRSPQADTEIDDPNIEIRRTYRKDGTLLAEVTYRDSIRHGLASNYYPNGRVQIEIEYVDGNKHGESRQYYQNGELFQVTPYVNGKMHGLRRQYYEGGNLRAEINFDNNIQLPGLREYSKDGNLLKRDATLLLKLVDKIALDGTFELEMQLSNGSEYVKFFRYFPDEGDGSDLSYPINAVNGKGIESFYVAPGSYRKQKVHIRAEETTRLRNKEIHYAVYHLDVKNK